MVIKVETEIITCIMIFILFFFLYTDSLTSEANDGESYNSQSKTRCSILYGFLGCGFY